MKKKAKRYIKILLFLVLGLLILWFITKGQDVNAIWAELKSANYFWVLLVMIISVLSHILRASRWNILVNSTGHTANLKQSFVAVMTGYLANLAVPRLGEITKCAALNKTSKVPFNVLVGTVVSERIVDFLSLVVIVLLTFSLQFSFVEDFLNKYFFNPISKFSSENFTLFLFSGILFLIILGFFWIFLKRKLDNPPKTSIFYKIKHHLVGFKTGLRSLWKMENKWAFLFQTVSIWGMYFLTVYLAFFAITGTTHLSPQAGLTMLAVGSIAILAPMPGGIGTFHLITILTLTELYGIASEQATSYAYITHASQTLVVILFGAAAWFFISLHQNKQIKKSKIISIS